MGPGEVAALGVAVIAFAVVSMRIERWPLTMPMVFVAAGVLGDATDMVDVAPDNETIVLLAEVTLAIILFSDAVRIDIRRLRRYLVIPSRLLAIGLPLTIVLGTLINALLFPELPLVQVALIAAILAPTDAALGTAVVEDETVPVRDRLALNVESGVNDGLVVPVVAVMTAIILEEEQSAADWVVFVTQQIGLGIVLGVVVGGGTIMALRWSDDRNWADARFQQLATFVVPIVALFAAEVVEGNSFIAAFVAGLMFGSFRSRPDEAVPTLPVRLGAFTEDAAQLFGLAAFFVFGNVLLADALADATVTIVVCAVLSLTVGRMVPVWVSLIGTSLKPPSRLFLGWFGPRGLASIVFGLLLLEDTESLVGVGEQVFGVIALTVAFSIVLHGATAAPGARLYGAWAARAMETGDESDRAEMMMEHELSDEERSMIPKGRWSLKR
ncbi:cation:proton antiporter [Ilumatobacter nonamiensis]|uniref:cation:proton antiporter n=1 Tax=Ilumatobacter nonamiensis TaxID=467093 RepID=UPI00034B7A40|nr:cation:proton antiporter [Ilumatobacter nonamiensis]